MRSYFMKGKKQKFGSTLSTVMDVFYLHYYFDKIYKDTIIFLFLQII